MSRYVLETTEAQAIREYYLKPENFFFFAKDICGYRDIRLLPHRSICDFMTQSPGNGSVRTSNLYSFPLSGKTARAPDKRRIILLAPRTSFKSSLCKAYIVWRLLRKPRLKIMVANYNEVKTENYLKEVDGLFARAELRAVFGDWTPNGKPITEKATWNKREKQLFDPYTEQLVPFTNMPNILGVGLGSSVAMYHPDLFIGDDLVTDDNVDSDDALEQPKEFIAAIEPCVNPGGEICLNGTRYHFNDLYGKVITETNYDVMLRSAWNEDNSLWFKERLSEDVLRAAEREMGTYRFACQYMNNPITPEDATFKEEWINSCTQGYSLSNINLKDLEIVIGADPARSTEKHADYVGIIAAGKDKNNIVWVLEGIRRRMNTKEFEDAVFDLYARWSPQVIGIESNGGQEIYIDLLRKEDENRKTGLAEILRPIMHSTRVNKEARIDLLIPYVERAQIRFSGDMQDLVSEMKRHPKEHPDLLDALEDAVSLLNPDPISFKKEKSLKELQSEYQFKISHDEYYKPAARMDFKDTFEGAMR